MKRILILGVNGFIGHHLSKRILADTTGWQRQGIEIYYNGYLQPYSPIPTPFAATNLDEALFNTLPELWLILAAGCLVYTGFSLWAWVFAARHRSPDAEHTAGWVFRPLRWLAAWIVLLVVAWLAGVLLTSLSGATAIILILVSLTLPLIVLILSLVLWRRASRLVARPGSFQRSGWLALLTGVGVLA